MTVIDKDRQKSLITARYSLAKKKAEELTAVYSSPPIPVLEIAQSNGVNVVFSNFGKHSDAVSAFCDFHGKRIFINERDAMTRKMFTMAHELGHWILHREFFENDPSGYAVLPRYSKPESNPFEQEANAFAAELLAPSRLVSPVKGAGATTLARIFGVSREMMEIRLKNV